MYICMADKIVISHSNLGISFLTINGSWHTIPNIQNYLLTLRHQGRHTVSPVLILSTLILGLHFLIFLTETRHRVVHYGIECSHVIPRNPCVEQGLSGVLTLSLIGVSMYHCTTLLHLLGVRTIVI